MSWVYRTELTETYLRLRTRQVYRKGWWFSCGTCQEVFEAWNKKPRQVPDPQNGPYGSMPVCDKCFSENEYKELWHYE